MREIVDVMTPPSGLSPIGVASVQKAARKLSKHKRYGEFAHIVPRFKTQLVRDGGVDCSTFPVFDAPVAAHAFFKTYIGDQIEEHFCAAALDSRNKVIGVWTVSVGILTASIVHPREVFRPAIELSAAAVILCHNHPSGDPTPSRDDDGVTERMAKAGDLIGIALLDHIIVGDTTYWSYRERGGIHTEPMKHPIVETR